MTLPEDMKKARFGTKLERIRFIVECYNQGMSQHEVRQQKFQGHSISHDLISRVYQSRKNNEDYFQHARNCGRPTVLNEKSMKIIDDFIGTDGRKTVEDIQKELVQKDNKRISRVTIMKALKLLGYRYRPPKKLPNLTMQQKEKRLIFSRSVLKNQIPLTKIIFSDESRFSQSSDKGYVWYRAGSKVVAKTMSHLSKTV